jgi:hypothetical protein
MTAAPRGVRGCGRGGFALPAAIMALVLLSALVAGALHVSTEELRAGRGDVANQRALAAAESALERAIVAWDIQRNTTLAVGSSIIVERYPTAGVDRAEVVATRVQRLAVWLTSRATSAADGRTIPARHTVAASLRFVVPRVPLRAALTAGGTVTVRDGSVDGTDVSEGREVPVGASLACADSAAAVAGLLVPDSLLACGVTCSGRPPAGVTGAPPVSTGLTSDSAGAPLGGAIREALVRNASVVLPGGTYAPRPSVSGVACDAADPLDWGDPTGGVCANLFRIIHVLGDLTLGAGSVGQGVLLADGNVRVEAGARFDGVVVAGNDIEVSGAGAAITGVAFAMDGDRAAGSRVTDGGAIRFASCVAKRAALGVARLERTPGRWWAELR